MFFHGDLSAAIYGSDLHLTNKPPGDLNVPTGRNLQLAAKTVLTVGSDCAIGKKTVAIELDREAQRQRDALVQLDELAK